MLRYHLHSNMSLFKFNYKPDSSTNKAYLHSNMSLFKCLTLQAVNVCIFLHLHSNMSLFKFHHPDSRFFSTLFLYFLLTSQSLQIFYHISFINSTKEKQNYLFFMLVEFCRCTGIFTLSEVDSLKIVVTE